MEDKKHFQDSSQPQMNQRTIPYSSLEEMDIAVETLHNSKNTWRTVTVGDRITLIDELIRDFASVSALLIKAETEAKGLQGYDFGIAQEFLNSSIVLRYLRGLRRALVDIQTIGRPQIPGPVTTRSDGQIVARIFPATGYDRILYNGYTMEVWMESGVNLSNLQHTQASAYHDKNRPGKVTLVLGAGNTSAISFSDIAHRLFVENQVVLLKMNPVNAYAGPIVEEGFRSLIRAGFLRLAYGGPSEGNYLCHHRGIDTIHITGSAATFESIIFGPGAEGSQRKTELRPVIAKPMTAELGCITPVIIVPGVWTQREIDYQTEKIASWLANNTGFTCNTPHLLVMHTEWPQRKLFLDAMRRKLTDTPLRKAYYPGAQNIHERFISAHPEAELFGRPLEDELPWTLIPSVSADNANEICFNTEAFCGLLAETSLNAASVPDFLDKAVDFVNQRVWGTLDAALFVHPASLKDNKVASTVDRAIADLRYGAVSINTQAVGVYFFPVAPWGSYAGQDIYNVQSGIGWVHNTLMFSRPQKVVLRAPFMELPRSPFLLNRAKIGRKLAPLLADFEAAPSPWKLPRILITATGW